MLKTPREVALELELADTKRKLAKLERLEFNHYDMVGTELIDRRIKLSKSEPLIRVASIEADGFDPQHISIIARVDGPKNFSVSSYWDKATVDQMTERDELNWLGMLHEEFVKQLGHELHKLTKETA